MRLRDLILIDGAAGGIRRVGQQIGDPVQQTLTLCGTALYDSDLEQLILRETTGHRLAAEHFGDRLLIGTVKEGERPEQFLPV